MDEILGVIVERSLPKPGKPRSSLAIGVEFKLLDCLRILGRGAYCDDVTEILSCGKITVNNMFKSFVKTYSEAFYALHVYVPQGEESDQLEVRWFSQDMWALWMLRILCGNSVLQLCVMFVQDVIIVLV